MPEREMQWLVEAARRAQEKRKQFASVPLSSHVPTGFMTGLRAEVPPMAVSMPRTSSVSPRERATVAIDDVREKQQSLPWEPTLQHQQFIENMRATKAAEEQRTKEFEEQMAFNKEKFEQEMALAREKFEADERYRQAQLALQRLAAASRGRSGGGYSGGGYSAVTPWGAVDAMVYNSLDLDDIMKYVNHKDNYAWYKDYGVTPDEMREYALDKYRDVWQTVLDVTVPPRGASSADLTRGFRQLEKAASEVRRADTYGMSSKFTDADYRRFAEITGRPVNEIREMDRLGWLEDYMQKFYEQLYKVSATDEDKMLELAKRQGIK